MMRMITILAHEWRMTVTRRAFWILFLFSILFAMIDCAPVPENIRRLAWICDINNYSLRVLSSGGLTLAFGMIFLLSGFIPGDRRTGVADILQTTRLRKLEYLSGKILGGLAAVLTAFLAFLAVCMSAYALLLPETTILACLLAGVRTYAVVMIPAAFFVAAAGVCLPVLLDIRLTYVLFALLFLLNILVVGSAAPMPSYLILTGDLKRLIWQHPAFPFEDTGAILSNLLFLFTGGIIPAGIVIAKKNYWRET